MKKILTMVFGLIGLIAVSSCDDHFSYDDKNEFKPVKYAAKTADTLEIYGKFDLVFDEIEKTDWQIITQSHTTFFGRDTLVLNTPLMMDITGQENSILEIPTNYGSIPVTFANVVVSYEYMGNSLILRPKDGLQLAVFLANEMVLTSGDYFNHSGDIIYYLLVGGIVVKEHKQSFTVSNRSSSN